MSDPEEEAWLEAYKTNEPSYVQTKDVLYPTVSTEPKGENKTITLEEEILTDPTQWG